jgi:endonuclease/exonuclease/phosphatase family metal-dependent hydrolase
MGGDHSRNMQWVKCTINNTVYTVMNVHGLWNGKGKTDTPERIAQSQRIREFMDTVDSQKILCGDFNLRPDTKSVEIITNGMNDLIKTFHITSTRTSLYGKDEQFVDYIFVSPDVNVKEFKVLPDEVSDHSPLFLEVA